MQARGKREAVAAVLSGVTLGGVAVLAQHLLGVAIYALFALALALATFAMATSRLGYQAERILLPIAISLFAVFTVFYLQEAHRYYEGIDASRGFLWALLFTLASYGMLFSGLVMRVFHAGTPRAKRILLTGGFGAYVAIAYFLIRASTGADDISPLIANLPYSRPLVLTVGWAAYLSNFILFAILATTSLPIRIGVFGPSGAGKSQILGVLQGKEWPWRSRQKTTGDPVRLGKIQHRGKNRYRCEVTSFDVGGEYFESWIRVVKNERMEGLVYVLDAPVDETEVNLRVRQIRRFADELNGTNKLQGRLRSILVLMNKRDQWEAKFGLEEVLGPYRDALQHFKDSGRAVIAMPSCAYSELGPRYVDVLERIDEYINRI